MSDLSDDTEALKHNFLFRGFFNNRGFFDLGALTTPEYRSATFGKGFKRYRTWMESAALFQSDAKGVERLSVRGKAILDEAMTVILKFPRNGPLMVEGFAGAGTAPQQYLAARRRAVRVQAYLISQFQLRPAYVGVVSMGAEPVEASGRRETKRIPAKAQKLPLMVQSSPLQRAVAVQLSAPASQSLVEFNVP